MSALAGLVEYCRVPVGKRVRLADYKPAWAGDENEPKKERKRMAEELLADEIATLSRSQELLYASDTWSVLVIFQALDAAGKDSTIKHVMTGLNPQGCQVHSFKHPSTEELDHTYLWRCMKALPERGRIGIFNRSYYEEVLIVRVMPELVASQRIPRALVTKELWESRYDDINAFERHLIRNGTAVVKFFLHVSYEEQKQRFLERINDPSKHWKFSVFDVEQRRHWQEYQSAYEDCLQATSSEEAPWYVVPADHKWITRLAVARILNRTLSKLDLRYPEVSDEQRAQIEACRQELERS